MIRPKVCVVLIALVLPLGSSAAADEPLPAPRIVSDSPGYFLSQPYPRRSAYEVWQNYGVDRRGFFRPVVVYSPYGLYYRIDGAPYPWTTTRQLNFMPYVVD